MTLGSLEVLGAEGAELDRWLAMMSQWASREVFAFPLYLKMFAQSGERPLCLVYREPEGSVVYPLLLRDVATAGFCAEGRAYDAVCPPFGWSGPFVETNGDALALAGRFYEAYERWAKSLGIVAEYTAFSPTDDRAWPYPGEVVLRAPSIVRDLSLDEDAMLMDYKSSLRRAVKAGMRSGIEVEIDPTGRNAREFLEVYESTMDRRQATASYRLDLPFLERMTRELEGYVCFFHAREGDRIISTEIVFISGESTFFFRGGTYFDKLPTRANQLLKHRIIMWSREQGKRYYILGGGTSAEDSLTVYKRTFAPNGEKTFRVGKWIVDPEKYQALVAERASFDAKRGAVGRPRPGFFPEYRAPLEEAHS